MALECLLHVEQELGVVVLGMPGILRCLQDCVLETFLLSPKKMLTSSLIQRSWNKVILTKYCCWIGDHSLLRLAKDQIDNF